MSSDAKIARIVRPLRSQFSSNRLVAYEDQHGNPNFLPAQRKAKGRFSEERSYFVSSPGFSGSLVKKTLFLEPANTAAYDAAFRREAMAMFVHVRPNMLKDIFMGRPIGRLGIAYLPSKFTPGGSPSGWTLVRSPSLNS
jgi:hypothetical protein